MNKQNSPNPNTLHPIAGVTRTVYLKNIITNPQIIVGDYTYYDDPEDPYNFENLYSQLIESFDENHGMGNHDKSFGCFGGDFIVFRKSSEVTQPCKCTLNDPSFG